MSPVSSFVFFDFDLSKSYKSGSRQVYNVFDIIQDIGGFQGIVFLFFSQFISTFFTSILFPFSLVRHTAPVNLQRYHTKMDSENRELIFRKLETSLCKFSQEDLVLLMKELKTYTKLHISTFI
jgi:hypothetical protein